MFCTNTEDRAKGHVSFLHSFVNRKKLETRSKNCESWGKPLDQSQTKLQATSENVLQIHPHNLDRPLQLQQRWRSYMIGHSGLLHYSRKYYNCPYDELYSVRGLEWSELGGSHGCPGAFGTDFYDRSTRTIEGTMLWTEYSSAPSLGQSILRRG